MERDQTYSTGDRVRHVRLGPGEVIVDRGSTVVVQFREEIQSCDKSELHRLLNPLEAIDRAAWDAPLDVITRCQAEAIRSVNDTWGIFSRSRIALLPHQLWVCKQVLENWPARWLVADDVGLGKTIEAGLILWPLVSRGTVRRFLIVCPASLVEQWQFRLRDMFDIRTTRYAPDADTPRSDFWNTHNQVVASLQTVRMDKGTRHERMMSADPWDLLLVDEAHHLNADAEGGPTLGYKLADQLVTKKQVRSVVFFTGTPHRGKDFGFFSLMRLLRPDVFDPRKPAQSQLPHLRDVMIRNNKQNVTNMHGERLFWPPVVTPETYQYSPAEARFYGMLTEFILSGKAYAPSLSAHDQRLVILVLIAMQKLASSSVAAIKRALRRRLARILAGDDESAATRPKESDEVSLDRLADQYDELEADDADAVSRLEEDVASSSVRLMRDEEPKIRELLAAAEEVEEETKVSKILGILDSQFANRPVLLFTEYKATQSLVMSALNRRYGDGCVTFINGDEMADDVYDADGKPRTMKVRREDAAEQFNSGQVRFLISTEAGGEGIDLQERCHSLIHIDLPWNPMRLHQRVGRLNRYGQTKRVEVVHLRNPDTVESRIWDKLNTKIESIMAAFGAVMEDPEDLLQLVLGMTSPALFRGLFSEGEAVPGARFSEWFDERTATFGGQDALDTVRELVGYASKFDFQEASGQIPRTDLPALEPFLKTMLALNSKQIREDANGLSFRTPEAWLDEAGVRSSYDNLVFDRQVRTRDAAQRVVGVGHKALDQALKQAVGSPACVASLPLQILPRPLILFTITDDVTTEGMLVRSVMTGVDTSLQAGEPSVVLRDWQILERLNVLLDGKGFRRARESAALEKTDLVKDAITAAQIEVEQQLGELSFRQPRVSLLAILWPDATHAASS